MLTSVHLVQQRNPCPLGMVRTEAMLERNCIGLTSVEPRFCTGPEKRNDVREDSGKLPRHARALNCCALRMRQGRRWPLPGAIRNTPPSGRGYLLQQRNPCPLGMVRTEAMLERNCIGLTSVEPRFCTGPEKRNDVREDSGKLPRHARALNCCALRMRQGRRWPLPGAIRNTPPSGRGYLFDPGIPF